MKNMMLAVGLLAATASAQAHILDFGNGPAAPAFCAGNSAGTGALQTCGNSG